MFGAIIIGSITGYFVSNTVLNLIYKYHIDASMIVSLLSSILIISIAVIAVISVVFMTATSNPADGLRDE